MMQHAFKRRRLAREVELEPVPVPIPVPVESSMEQQRPVRKVAAPVVAAATTTLRPKAVVAPPQPAVSAQKPVAARQQPIRSMDGTIRLKRRQSAPAPAVPPARSVSRPVASRRLMTDMRPPTRRMIDGVSPLRPGSIIQAQNE